LSLAVTEEGAEVTHKYKAARENEYATSSDFCRIFIEQMNNLYLLSLLLTADRKKAEECFLSGFEDSLRNNSVFKERAYLWARRSIVLQAIRLLRPQPSDENESSEARLSPLMETVPAEMRAYPNFVRVVRLNSLERFVFIMSVLEMYSQQECSLIFRTDTMQSWQAKLRAAGIPASPVRRLDEVVNDPQSAVREMFPYTTDPVAGPVRVVGSPIKFTNQPASALSSAPELGQDTNKALSDWFGMDSTELSHLQAAGVILQAGDMYTQT
jgi:hypothetical protein